MISAQKITQTSEAKVVIRPLLYFDIFNYPITIDEIKRFAPLQINSSIHQALDELVLQGKIFLFDDFYSIQDNPFLALRRKAGNDRAKKKLVTAKKYAGIISSFPFVRAVMLSGSISKGFMDKKSDIDYFIITEKNRLWIVRTMLALFRRIFLFNFHKNFCTNYFIDQNNLEIKEKNFFTAIELATLVPMKNSGVIDEFIRANAWIKEYLPNEEMKTIEKQKQKSLMSLFSEKIFSIGSPDQLNRWLMNKTKIFWKKKYGKEMNAADFEIAFRSAEGVSKSHPQFFQKKVLNHFEQKINRYEQEHGIDLSL